MAIFSRFFSKKIREIESSLLQSIKELENKHLKDFIQNLNYLDPDRSFTSILNEIELGSSINCLYLKKADDLYAVSNFAENSPKSMINFTNSMHKYPFVHITINKSDILIKKLRYLRH
jgi:hypothetical protein